MIINYTEKDGKKGIWFNENKDNVKLSKTGKSYSFLISEHAKILVKNGDKQVEITGAELIAKFF